MLYHDLSEATHSDALSLRHFLEEGGVDYIDADFSASVYVNMWLLVLVAVKEMLAIGNFVPFVKKDLTLVLSRASVELAVHLSHCINAVESEFVGLVCTLLHSLAVESHDKAAASAAQAALSLVDDALFQSGLLEDDSSA